MEVVSHFIRVSSGHRALDGPIRAPQGSRTEPHFFCELRCRFGALQIANRRFEAIRANRSNIKRTRVFVRIARPSKYRAVGDITLAHQNRTIAIAIDFRVDGAKSPEIPQKEGVLGSEIAARNRRSLATFHRTLKSQCIIAVSCLGNRAISGVHDGHRNRKSQKSLRFRCAKDITRDWVENREIVGH